MISILMKREILVDEFARGYRTHLVDQKGELSEDDVIAFFDDVEKRKREIAESKKEKDGEQNND